MINMLEPIEYICMMGPNSNKESNYDIDDERPKVVLKMWSAQQQHRDTWPKVVLRVAESSSLHGEPLNVVTRGQ